jgi:hypothetical protein
MLFLFLCMAGLNLSQYAASPMMLQTYRVFEATEKRQDGRYAREYWNFIDPPSHRNSALDRLTAAWGKLLKKSNEKGNRIRVATTADTTLIWNAKTARAAAID